MPTFERIFAFNTSQQRNLRNWLSSEIPAKTIPVAVAVHRPRDLDAVRTAIGALARRHEELRSRLVDTPDGDRAQAVVSPEDLAYPLEIAEAVDGVDPDALAARLLSAAKATPAEVDPTTGAFRCTVHQQGGRVIAVLLCISHIFTDGIGSQVLRRDLTALLHDGLPAAHPPPQAHEFGYEAVAETVRRNTGRWKELLADVPRSCTYSGVPRAEYESVQVATLALAPRQYEEITEAARRLRVSPYVLWVTAVSAFVQTVTGQHQQVFRSTYANRFTPEQFDAVTPLAQAVYLPIHGGPQDTLEDRAAHVMETTVRTYDWGLYDAVELQNWLNRPDARVNAVFQPAFEVNYEESYLLPPTGTGSDRGARPTRPIAGFPARSLWTTRIDPFAAKADLFVTVSGGPGPTVRLLANKPVSAERAAIPLLKDLLTVVRALCGSAHQRITDLPVPPFPSAARHAGGHVSGTAVDLPSTRALMLDLPGVEECQLDARPGTSGPLRVTAQVRTRTPVSPQELTEAARAHQPWFSGSVVPDEVVIADG